MQVDKRGDLYSKIGKELRITMVRSFEYNVVYAKNANWADMPLRVRIRISAN
jgi:hypothetical protein